MPGYLASKTAEMPPRKRPSTSAYMGAVTGAHSFLKIVTIARMKPPIRPPHTYRPPVMPSGVIATLLQAKAAVITASTSRIAVLPNVPFRVIAPPAAREKTVPTPGSKEVESFRDEKRRGNIRTPGTHHQL